MRQRQFLAFVVVVAVAGGLAPSTGLAHGPRGGSAGVVVTSPFPRTTVSRKPVDSWKFWPPKVAPRRHRFDHFHGFASPFTPSFVGAPSLMVTTTTPQVVDGYATPLLTYAPAPLAAVPALTALPTPTLIDYPTGWYQLRGDGVTSPYTWVWIPRPPASPAPEVASPPRVPESSLPTPPAERGPAYHWTDERGVTTWTNRLDRIPKRFRDEAAATAAPD